MKNFTRLSLNIISLFLISTQLLLISTQLRAQMEDEAIIKRALARMKVLAAAEDVVQAIRAQNAAHATLAQSEIDTLDADWQANRETPDHPLIQSVLENESSSYLAKTKARSRGLYREVFIMDAKGLLVGSSDVTSDYWQGDEDKWQKTYAVGPDAYFIDELKQDASTGAYQIQISYTVTDPATGKAIGAVTAGIHID